MTRLIQDELRRNPSYTKVARRIGVTVAQVREAELAQFRATAEALSEVEHRQRLEPYIVATRRSWEPWPTDMLPATLLTEKARQDWVRIQWARTNHDLGFVNLCTGRAGDTIILYALPNKVPVQRHPYFNHDLSLDLDNEEEDCGHDQHYG